MPLVDDDKPIDIRWLHRTAPPGSVFYGNGVEIPILIHEVRRWRLKLGRNYGGSRRATLWIECHPPPIRGACLHLNGVSTRGELRRLYTILARDIWPQVEGG